MKKTGIIFIFFTLLTLERIMAQTKDSVPAKKVVENGTKGDLIIGKENKKSQLMAPPQPLKQKDTLHKQSSTRPQKKKAKNKSRKEGK